MPAVDYTALSKVEFTEQDIALSLDEVNKNETRQLVYLTVDNLDGGVIPPATLETFAKLARTLGYPVTRYGAGLQVARPLTTKEARESALTSLKYGYTPLAIKIRDERAAEQGITIYKPEPKEDATA